MISRQPGWKVILRLTVEPMRNIKFGTGLIIMLSLTLLVTACDEIQVPQKYVLKGTTTKTPFQAKSTFTTTSAPPPTQTASQTPSGTPSYTSTEEITETPTATASETATLEIASVTSSPIPNKPTKPPTAISLEKPTVRVSVTTNCRTGPGVTYPKLTPLLAGRVVPLVGREKSLSYWIIKDPGNTGRDCWLWGYYATTTGNIYTLPLISPPV
ncbi:MAG TPA: hypothetical protein ENF27_02225, partial [Chloroflexi bacterium]|nr:hypothetical protein [Chloroflexota bacterium]